MSLEDFFQLAGRLKRLRRTGWIERNISEAESVADHTFRVALMTMTFVNLKRTRGEAPDLEKALCLALLHDLSEAFTGDLDPETKKRLGEEQVKKKNEQAVTKILLLLPDELRAQYRGLFSEFQAQTTKEARLVKDIDRSETVLQAWEYAKLCKGSRLDEFWRDHGTQIGDDDVASFLRSLLV